MRFTYLIQICVFHPKWHHKYHPTIPNEFQNVAHQLVRAEKKSDIKSWHRKNLKRVNNKM